MGTLGSPCESIRELRFQPVPVRPVKAKKLVRHDSVIVIDAGDVLYTNCNARVKAHFLVGKYPWIEPLLECLVRLKRITSDDRWKHLDVVNERDISDRKKDDRRRVFRFSNEFGITFSARQLKQIEKVIEG